MTKVWFEGIEFDVDMNTIEMDCAQLGLVVNTMTNTGEMVLDDTDNAMDRQIWQWTPDGLEFVRNVEHMTA